MGRAVHSISGFMGWGDPAPAPPIGREVKQITLKTKISAPPPIGRVVYVGSHSPPPHTHTLIVKSVIQR
jgi:hypothetical protein